MKNLLLILCLMVFLPSAQAACQLEFSVVSFEGIEGTQEIRITCGEESIMDLSKDGEISLNDRVSKESLLELFEFFEWFSLTGLEKGDKY